MDYLVPAVESYISNQFFADSTEYAQPPVVLADYSLDADDDDIAYGGRQVYGNYKKKNKPTVVTSTNEGGEDDRPHLGNANNVTCRILARFAHRLFRVQMLASL
ncbi:hypothetical protein BJX65DRAFT_304167 [Aspergillus insuetus]